jgi:hypothetical protein
MQSPRNLNPAITSQTDQAILWSLAMHPDQRPSDIYELRAALLAPGPVTRTVSRLFDQEAPVTQFISANRVLLGIVGALLLIASLVTARPSTIPPQPPATATPTATYTPMEATTTDLSGTETISPAMSVSPSLTPTDQQ